VTFLSFKEAVVHCARHSDLNLKHLNQLNWITSCELQVL